MSSLTDADFMRHALRLAMRGLGQTAPNPAVGAVLVKDHHIIGIGSTGDGGRPHAEPQAIAMAGKEAAGATLYVTLEPCAHQGQTPPCTQAIIDAKIARVVCACTDPDKRVAGKGFEQLKQAGIEVETGCCEQEAWKLNEGFFLCKKSYRPLITVKIATSANAQMVTADSESPLITSEKAREHAQLLRTQHDAILTGIGTVLADNPLLTCRIQGLEKRSPLRIVMDSDLQIPEDSMLVHTALTTPVWVLTKPENAEGAKAQSLKTEGIRVQGMDLEDMPGLLSWLSNLGITRLMVEAGPTLTASFLRHATLLYWYQAPHDIHHHATDLPLNQLEEEQLEQRISLGLDTLSVYRLQPCLPVSSQT